MKRVAVNPDETAQLFATRWGRTVPQVIADNPEDTSLDALSKRTGTFAKLSRSSITHLLVPDDAVDSSGSSVSAVTPASYNLAPNNTTDWDWLIWETEGNSSPKYQRGGRERKLGLYSLNYDLLRKAGQSSWVPAHTDGTVGGGWIKIAILKQLDYGQHQELIQAFLPCYSNGTGKVLGKDDEKSLIQSQSGAVSRSPSSGTTHSTLNSRPPLVIMPFNYDDNSNASAAIGTKLNLEPLGKVEAKRLAAELTRWASASRSTITAFPTVKPGPAPHATKPQDWNLRPTTTGSDTDFPKDSNLPQVKGDSTKKSLKEFQGDVSNNGKRYYSVKTGVDYVATQNQHVNGKDLLEANSVHAMSRSDVIAGTVKKRGNGRFEAQYQLEILSILLDKGGGNWDGIQIREIGNAGTGEVWFPALAIPSHGQAFAKAWTGDNSCDWVAFWEKNFAIPLGRAKAEMMSYFGMQHMTSNAQNFLVVFDRANQGSDAKYVILRDIGDTILNTIFFDELKKIDQALFEGAWAKEVADKKDGIVLVQNPTLKTIGGSYSNPQITRIGTGIVFYFPPFLEGDLDTSANPRAAEIAARWSVASNNGFLQYMKDKLGYAESGLPDKKGYSQAFWDKLGYHESWPEGIKTMTSQLKKSIRADADLSLRGKSDEYAQLASDVLPLSSGDRLTEMRSIEQEIAVFQCDHKDKVAELQNLCAGHELMITAEIHQFIRSKVGKAALWNLHQRGGQAAEPGYYEWLLKYLTGS